MNKRAISNIVSTTLIIMIVVAAVGIIGAFVLPMVKQNLQLNTVCNSAIGDVYIDTSSGYSCVDLDEGILPVQITKGPAQIDYSGARIIVKSGGKSYPFDINSELGAGQTVFYLNVGKLSSIDSIELYPIVSTGTSSKICDSASSVKISDCNLAGEVLASLVSFGDNQNILYSPQASSKKVQGKYIDGLIGYWTFDEGDYNDTHVFDISGRNKHGIGNGGVAIEGDVIEFDGVDDEVSLTKRD